QYEFDRIYKLYQMSVWNYNTSVEPLIGFGIKEAIIEYSVDGATWAMLGTTHELTKGPGAVGYAPNTTVDFGGVAAKYVKITANSNWGGIVNQFGLSEVRFLSIPVLAREPSPISGATDVGVDATLSWRAGREAGRHDVYLSTDEQAVIDGTVPVAIVTEAGYAPSLDLAGTYYWRIDEINDVETPTTWQGDIWSLSTQEYLVVDDFESYNDIEAGQEGSNLIYWTWVDGFDNPTTNGSAIGYTVPFQPTMEAESVHGGDRSVPLTYDNSVASLSEVAVNTSDLAIGPDWTKGAPETLVLWFYGDAGNAVTEQMYVKVNNVKAVYDGDINNIVRRRWTQWNIDLASLGISLSNVTSLTIGFERTGASGGTGKVLIDDIRLYRVATPIPKPADPASTGLVAYYAMDNNAEDGSGNGNHGTLQGAPQWVEGLIGKALQFNGGTDYVEVADAPGLDIINTITIAAWIKANTFGNWRGFVVKGLETAPYAMQMWGDGSLRFGWNYGSPPGAVGNGLVNSNGKMPLGEWAHLAVTYDGSTLSFYINGGLDTQETDVSLVFGTNDEPLILGCDFPGGDEYFDGAMDDVRVYNRALSPSEVMFLGDLIP
ncbi:MAG TPA: LamG domain-containing protein, partial [Sedimentisphaerales bacterium]|nr:LamG domain-containing protein [Sedimentisphaerales bacterium]